MNARGTRRPHPRRVRPKPVKTSRRSGGGSTTGCALILFALVAAPTVGFGLWLVIR